MMRRLAALPAGALCLAPAAAVAITPVSPPTPVAVLIRADAIMDACPSTMRPRLPRGGRDGYLSLRVGPGVAWPEIARLARSDLMFACDDAPGWTAVVVQPPGGGDCAIPTPARALQRYRGPCRHGWVATRFLETVAG